MATPGGAAARAAHSLLRAPDPAMRAVQAQLRDCKRGWRGDAGWLLRCARLSTHVLAPGPTFWHAVCGVDAAFARLPWRAEAPASLDAALFGAAAPPADTAALLARTARAMLVPESSEFELFPVCALGAPRAPPPPDSADEYWRGRVREELCAAAPQWPDVREWVAEPSMESPCRYLCRGTVVDALLALLDRWNPRAGEEPRDVLSAMIMFWHANALLRDAPPSGHGSREARALITHTLEGEFCFYLHQFVRT